MRAPCSSSRDGHDNIYIMHPDGSDQRNLTQSSAINNDPTWSPDGQKIVFWSDRFGTPNIFIMNRDGTGLKDLTRNTNLDAELASWPKDGSIVFHGRPVQTGFITWVEQHAAILISSAIVLLFLAGAAFWVAVRQGAVKRL